MCMAVVSFLGCDVINFEINLIFLIKPFLYMTKKSRQKFKYLENEITLKVKLKAFFNIFIGLSFAKNCPRRENAPTTIKNQFMTSLCFFNSFDGVY